MNEHKAAADDAADDRATLSGATDEAGARGTDSGAAASAGGTGTDDVEALRRQAEENWSQYLRAVAEIDNLRKRSAREVENARKFGIERLLASILPVRDSLEAGLNAVRDADPASVDLGALLEGEQATLRLLDQALEAAGIVEIDPEGEPFDPQQHEAMSMLPSATAEPNSVLAVVQKGYALHERIVRPARVVVAQAPPTSEQGSRD